jgi:hypothetical protein
VNVNAIAGAPPFCAGLGLNGCLATFLAEALAGGPEYSVVGAPQLDAPAGRASGAW